MKNATTLEDLVNLTIESLNSEVSYLRVMSLGRPDEEIRTINQIANSIARLGARLEKSQCCSMQKM